jgi:hypothetical protein
MNRSISAPRRLSPAAAADSPGLLERAIRASRVRHLYWHMATRQAEQRPYLQLLQRASQLEGDVIECGVYQGKSLLRIATWLKERGIRKMIHGLDSFDGFPRDGISEADLGRGRTLQQVRQRFRGASQSPYRILRTAADLDLPIKLHVGYFEETLPRLIASGKRFCFVHLDCDLYESYRLCLEKLYDATVKGGVILFDEYKSTVWRGATRAIDEFLAGQPEQLEVCQDLGRKPGWGKYYVMKQMTQRAALSRAA